MKKICSYLTIPILLFLFPSIIVADLECIDDPGCIDDHLGNDSDAQANFFWGLKMTTPFLDPEYRWRNITFNLHDRADGSSVAFGDSLYLFSSAYTGTPSDMLLMNPGDGALIAKGGSSGIEWLFKSSLLLYGDTSYYFYTGSRRSSTLGPALAFDVGGGTLEQGWSYSAHENASFTSIKHDHMLAFTLRGDVEPNPEPATLLLLGTGLLGLWGYRKWKSA